MRPTLLAFFQSTISGLLLMMVVVLLLNYDFQIKESLLLFKVGGGGVVSWVLSSQFDLLNHTWAEADGWCA